MSTHHEVELLRLLLVGPPLSDAGFAEVRLRHRGLDRLGGAAVVEALGHVVVFDGHHVLDGGEGGLRCLFDLGRGGRNSSREIIYLFRSLVSLHSLKLLSHDTPHPLNTQAKQSICMHSQGSNRRW